MEKLIITMAWSLVQSFPLEYPQRCRKKRPAYGWENFRHDRNQESVKFEIVNQNGKTIIPKVAKLDMDFQILKEEFIEMYSLWDLQGCYALFHRVNPIKFKVTNLAGKQRYRALDNFQWNLEIAIPDSASDGWGQILSPDRKLIDKLIQIIEKE